ncbi:MAG TPA: O-antigen ligase family protein [Gaiellaceae bacterium]|nr:O-antigen ligase family protein [Gaiellaceae bacterium]
MRRPGPGGVTLSAAVAGIVVAAIFFGEGLSEGRLFWIGVAVLVVTALGWILAPPTLSRPGIAFLASLGGLVVWQALSIHWSISPASSWDYANRGLVYLAFACAGVLLGGVPRTRVARGLAEILFALLAVALAAKVVPALYGDYGRLARLRWPVEYWNELALLAAASVPLALWLGGRREAKPRGRIAGALLLYLAFVSVVLTFSRFGIVLAVLAAVVWLVLERDRLDSLPALVAALPAAGVSVVVGLALPGIAHDGESHSARVRDGVVFGIVLVACAVAVVLVMRALVARDPDVPRRRRFAARAGITVVLVCVLGLAALVVHAGGPVAFVQDRWHEFSATQSVNGPVRLGSASSGNRWTWWQQAWNAFTHHPGGGTGAGTFELTSTVAAHNSLLSTIEPHNTPLQFLSETGIVGFLLYAAMIAAVVFAVVRGPRDPATLALALAALVAVVHSAVDIDWDFVATQGPLFALAGVLVSKPPERALAPARAWLPAAGVAVCCLAALYSLFSPWYSARRLDAALSALDRMDFAAAHADASSAHSLNPLALDPLYVLAATDNSMSYLIKATKREPTNPDPWFELATYEAERKNWRAAYVAANHSYTLDRFGPVGVRCGLLDEARFEAFGEKPKGVVCHFL